MITFSNVSKVFPNGVKALDNVNLHIEEGKIYGVIGLSGAGKSTLIRCINGLERPTEGHVFVDGKDITTLSPGELREMRKEIGMIFQSFNLFDSMTIFDNVAYPLKIQKVPKEQIAKAVKEMLELVGIEEKVESYPSQLSGGQKQRVAIARALVSKPKILLLDEATSALDPATSDVILELIRNLKEKLGLTVVLITHDMGVVKSICNEVSILEGGEVIEEGRITKVFRSPHLKKVHYAKDLPPGIITGKPLSLTFSSSSAKLPVISRLIRDEGIEVNILLGNIEYVDQEALGSLLIEINPEDEDKVREYLKSNGVEVEDY